MKQKLEIQHTHATNWRDTCLCYFQSVNQKPFPDYLKDEIPPEDSASALPGQK